MKKSKFIHKACALLMLLSLASCADDNNGENQPGVNPADGLPITATLDTRSVPENLTCKLYVFRKASNELEYTCKETIVLDGQLPYRMKFSNDDLTDKSYRFVFTALPTSGSELTVYNSGNQEFVAGNRLADFIIGTNNEIRRDDYYYGIVDKTGTEILNEGTIRAELERIVGQIVLDVFRIQANINEPLKVQSATIASVLDRVHQIDIAYSDLTKELGIDEDGNLVTVTSWGTPLEYSINPNLGDTLQVYIPQTEKGLEISAQKVDGSARIKGLYGLPSSIVRAKYVFKYHDTTPTCGNADGGNHTVGCYDDQRILTLNLPQTSEEDNLLRIIPNNFTVNKAGIRLDRIIDLNVSSAFELQTAWDNEITNP